MDRLVYQIPAGTIPFSFRFNDAAYTGGYVSTNGFITFGTVAPHSGRDYKPVSSTYYDANHPISSTDDTGYDGAISAVGATIRGGQQSSTLGELRRQTLGTTPNRVFVIQWSNVFVFADGGNNLNFQIRLYETSNVVELAYGACAPGRSNLVQVGLRGYDPGDFATRTGTSWPASVAGSSPPDALPLAPATRPPAGLRYTFTPGPPLPCPQPFSLVATAVTGTSATLTWRTNGPAASPGPYDVVYSPAGFNPATATPVSAPAAGLPISGLQPYTNYDFYVTQRCGGAAGSSPRSAKGSFRTTVLNDDPIGALPLPLGSTCQPVSSTLAGSTITAATTAPGYQPTLCGSPAVADLRHDVWFTFTTAATGPGSTGVQLEGPGTSPYQLRVFTSAGGAAGPFVPVFCGLYPRAAGAVLVVAPLLPSTTYYVAVNSNAGALATLGPFSLCARVPPACSDPTTLLVRQTTSTTALLTFVPGNGATGYTVTHTPVSGGTTTTVTSPPVAPIALSGLIPATNYTLTLQANCGGGSQSAVLTGTISTLPANITPATAQALPVLPACQPVPGSNLNAPDLMPGVFSSLSLGCGANSFVRAVWYTFVTAASGPASRAVRIRVTGAAAGQVRVLSASSAAGPFTELTCAGGSDTAAAPLLEVPGLSPSTTYYVAVADYGGFPSPQGPFTICITEPATCGSPLGLGITGITGNSANLSFLAGSPPANSYQVSVAAQGATPNTFATTGATGLIPLTGLLPGTYYTATLTANCGPAGLSQPQSVVFRTSGPPANDACTAAQTLTCGQSLLGFTTGATTTGDPAPGTLCGPAVIGGAGVWYRFVGTGDDVTFSTCGSPILGQGAGFTQALHVFTGTCGSLVCLGSNANDTACPPTSNGQNAATYTVATTAGTPYYLFISGLSGTSGDFTLAATCLPAGTCPPPTNVALTVNAAGTLATVSFVPAPGAAYTVVSYALASGITANPYARGRRYLSSPASLDNLQPGQQYMLTLSSECGPGSRSVALTVPFSATLASRNAALAAQVELFPNPAHHSATLTLPEGMRQQPATATLYNSLGQVVRDVPIAAGASSTALDLHGLATGAYWLRLHTSQGTFSKRLSVE